jgi:hypothetical protein
MRRFPREISGGGRRAAKLLTQRDDAEEVNPLGSKSCASVAVGDPIPGLSSLKDKILTRMDLEGEISLSIEASEVRILLLVPWE